MRLYSSVDWTGNLNMIEKLLRPYTRSGQYINNIKIIIMLYKTGPARRLAAQL